MLRVLLLGMLILLSLGRYVAAQPLDTLYFERPPYYATVNGQPDGLLLNLCREILTRAGVPHAFQEMPPGRILETIKANQGPVCSIGWFKTPERERGAVFSLPIYQDEPLRAVFLKSGAMPPPNVSTFAQLAEQTSLTLGLNQAYVFGRPVDTLVSKMRTPPVKSAGTQAQLMRMLAAGRFDYMLVNPAEIETLAELANIPMDELHVLELDDLPKGNLRYLMFSKATPPEVIERINAVIMQMVKLED
ncbi:MAG: substrate-binding periplasmic protein [Acidobacteriota bacterium]